MKKLTLLLFLLFSITIFTQEKEKTLRLNNTVKENFKSGKYIKIKTFFINKMDCKQYVFIKYDVFKNDDLDDYNYVFSNVSNEKEYNQTIHYAVTNLLNPEIKVNKEVFDNYTALCQVDEEDNYHIVFILGDSPHH